MTETDRIIEMGILPESFFEEEIRNDFLVTTSRKKLWAVLLDLLLEFDRVCKKNGINYYLNSGTLLGAIRHKGFIPWDDDIDVCMMRDDYKKLLDNASDFKDPYFLQTPYTDKNSFYSFAKLRNSNTTQASKNFIFQDFNHGVLIDIYPVDKWDPKDSASYDFIRYLAFENSTYMRKDNPFLDDSNRYRVKTHSGLDPLTVYESINKIAQRYRNIETDKLLIAVCTISKYEKNLCSVSDYKETILADFEGYQFPIPSGYENILRVYYGNYMEFPPVEQRGLWHNDLIIDTEVPYKTFVKKFRSDILKKC